MKKILRDQSGMALPTVLGIMLVVAILATGMFYFSYNELNFSTMNKEQGQAQYLAKAGVEIAAKAFPGVSNHFFDETTESGGTAQPVKATLYLHKDAEGEPRLNSTEADNKGKVEITVTQESRDVKTGAGESTQTVNVWAYEAVATVDGSSSKAKGFTLPTAKATTKKDGGSGSGSGSGSGTTEQNMHLNWMNPSGVISKEQKNENQETVYQDGESTQGGVITGLIDEIFGTGFGKIYGSYTIYNGVVTVDEDSVDKVSISTDQDRVFAWVAPAVVFEVPLDLRNSREITGLALVSNTIIFEDEVHIYANNTETRVGDLILQPSNGTARVYFQDNVYVHIGSSRHKLFNAGTVWEFNENVDVFTWAITNNKIQGGVSNWLRKLFKNQETGTLTQVTDAGETMPNTNSLTKIIWE